MLMLNDIYIDYCYDWYKSTLPLSVIPESLLDLLIFPSINYEIFLNVSFESLRGREFADVESDTRIL